MGQNINFYRISKQTFDSNTSYLYKVGGIYFISDNIHTSNNILVCTKDGVKGTATFEKYTKNLQYVNYNDIDSALGVEIYSDPTSYIIIKDSLPLFYSDRGDTVAVFVGTSIEELETYDDTVEVFQDIVYIDSQGTKNFVKNEVQLGTKDCIEEIEKSTAIALTDLNSRVDGKQDTLVSGTNIKTINEESILGEGNIVISGGETSLVEITYSELKTLRDNNNLKPGCLYRITDFVTTVHVLYNTIISAKHPFDIIVLATSESTLSEEAKAIQHEGDTYFANSNLAAWKIWYCLDNDISRFHWTGEDKNKSIILTFEGDTRNYYRNPEEDNPDYVYGICWNNDLSNYNFYTNTENPEVGDIAVWNHPSDTPDYPREIEGLEEAIQCKGVIYRMIDEFNNDVPYDFKNIQFYRKFNNTYYMYSDLATSEDGIAAYTFSSQNPDSTNKFVDASMMLNNYIHDNIINKCIEEYEGDLPNNCFFGVFNRYNIIKANCDYNTFGTNNLYNILEQGCRYNIFISNNNRNAIESDSYECIMMNANNNIIGYNSGGVELIQSSSNIIKMFIMNIKLNNSNYNIVENFSNHIELYASDVNVFGVGCSIINLKNSSDNTFKNYCNNIIFASDVIGELIGQYFNNNIIESNVSDVILYNTSTASSSQVVKNYHIKSGVKGTSSSPIVIEVTRNLDYVTTVAKKSNGNIVKYCEADLIADQN